MDVYVPTRLPAASITGPVESASLPPSCTSTVSGDHEKGACAASKYFCQRVSTWAGPRSGTSASQMTSGAIIRVKALTSRSARVLANAVSVARTSAARLARSPAAETDAAAHSNTSALDSFVRVGFIGISLRVSGPDITFEGPPAHTPGGT